MKIKYLTLIEVKYVDASTIKRPNRKRRVWVCLCDCGKICTRYEEYLKSSDVDLYNTSCGCKQGEKVRGCNSTLWGGHGEISGNFFAELRCRSKHRKLNVEVTIEQLWELFLKQDRKCALTGQELTFQKSVRTRCDATASIDRKNSNKHYTIDNVQFVHKDVNRSKSDFDEEYFIQMCNLIAKNHPREPRMLSELPPRAVEDSTIQPDSEQHPENSNEPTDNYLQDTGTCQSD